MGSPLVPLILCYGTNAHTSTAKTPAGPNPIACFHDAATARAWIIWEKCVAPLSWVPNVPPFHLTSSVEGRVGGEKN